MLEDFYIIAQQLGKKLQRRHLVLTTAESCTGGLVAATLTSVPGCSVWFDCGFVTYSNMAKQHLLQVPADILDQYGAVSAQTVRAMAEGALRQSQANISIAITGIAGPEGGTADCPVGTVWFGYADEWQGSDIQHRLFTGERHEIRQQCVKHALESLLLLI